MAWRAHDAFFSPFHRGWKVSHVSNNKHLDKLLGFVVLFVQTLDYLLYTEGTYFHGVF